MVLRGLLGEQTRGIDRFDVYLKGSTEIPADYPRDERIRYVREYPDSGPWTRFLSAEGMANDDVLVTVDDDTEYPPDFVERGCEELERAGIRSAVSYGGILWDPLAEVHGYIENSWRFLAYRALDRTRTVAFHMGVAGFFRAGDLKGAVEFPLPGFKTNDDMMIAFALQRRNVRILTVPRSEGWIVELETASAGHALYRRDADVRHVTFHDLVGRLGFDPTACELTRIRANPQRTLVISPAVPQVELSGRLDEMLRSLCCPGRGVHVIAPVPSSLFGKVMVQTDTPYYVHAVTVPERGGRLDSFPPVKAWRDWRVDRGTRTRWARRLCLARKLLEPTDVHRYEDGVLVPENAG